MWKKQGSWNFFHAKLIPNSSNTINSHSRTSPPCEEVDTAGKTTVAYSLAMDVIPSLLLSHTEKSITGTNMATRYIPISVALRHEKKVSPVNINL